MDLFCLFYFSSESTSSNITNNKDIVKQIKKQSSSRSFYSFEIAAVLFCFPWLFFNFSVFLFPLYWLLTEPSWALHIWDFNLNPNFFDTLPHALEPFVRPNFSISCLMFEHSFSSSDTRILMLSIPTFKTWFSLTAVPQPPSLDPTIPLLNCLDPSRLSETRKQPAIEVLSWSCSKKRTWTIILRGSLSFCAAWVQASKESFWQSISRQSCSLSDSPNHGCDCRLTQEWEKLANIIKP